jgi:hypothetical protein
LSKKLSSFDKQANRMMEPPIISSTLIPSPMKPG